MVLSVLSNMLIQPVSWLACRRKQLTSVMRDEKNVETEVEVEDCMIVGSCEYRFVVSRYIMLCRIELQGVIARYKSIPVDCKRNRASYNIHRAPLVQ